MRIIKIYLQKSVKKSNYSSLINIQVSLRFEWSKIYHHKLRFNDFWTTEKGNFNNSRMSIQRNSNLIVGEFPARENLTRVIDIVPAGVETSPRDIWKLNFPPGEGCGRMEAFDVSDLYISSIVCSSASTATTREREKERDAIYGFWPTSPCNVSNIQRSAVKFARSIKYRCLARM